jgi:hypothetical protein
MDTARLYDELVEIRKRMKRLEDISGITHFCDLRDEETERKILAYLENVPEASERDISNETSVELSDLRCYTASMLYRDLIMVTGVESEVHDGYATSIIRKLGVTDEGRLYLEEITE